MLKNIKNFALKAGCTALVLCASASAVYAETKINSNESYKWNDNGIICICLDSQDVLPQIPQNRKKADFPSIGIVDFSKIKQEIDKMISDANKKIDDARKSVEKSVSTALSAVRSITDEGFVIIDIHESNEESYEIKETTDTSQTNETETETTTDDVVSNAASFAKEVLKYTNEERTSRGLPALSLDNGLSRVAQAHANDMAAQSYFSHTSKDGRTLFDRLSEAGINNWGYSGENIAQGYPDAKAVVEGWMNSEGHRENILKSSFRHLGVGYNSNGNYWVQVFTD